MSRHLWHVGISRMAVSDQPNVVIRTHSLGSCAGVAVYAPEAGVGGLLHAQLPLASLNPMLAEQNPCVFVDTGIEALLAGLLALGVRRGELVVKIAGCARRHLGTPIGEQNYEALRAALARCELVIEAEDVGGTAARTLSLFIADGCVEIESNGQRHCL